MNNMHIYLTFLLHWHLVTDRIRSMGEGNILTGVCLSTGGGGLLWEGGFHANPPQKADLPPPPPPPQKEEREYGRYASYWNEF